MGRGNQVPDYNYIDNDAFSGLHRGLARVSEGRLASEYVPGYRTRRCHAGAFNMSIADTGDVYPCHLFHQASFKLGNIFTDTFDDIFDGKRNREYVASMDVEANNSICAACEVRFLCGGGCKANALHSSGDHHRMA
jgi:radical SAM protein with 4Fe4S-binding SPASM domain